MSENNHIMHLHEGITKRDNAKFVRGHVVAYVKGTNTVLFEKDNKVILPGSTFTALKHFKDLKLPGKLTKSYNEALGLDNSQSVGFDEKIDSYIWLFAVGTDGCGAESSQVIDVDYTKWIQPESLVPFRYPLSTMDTAENIDRNKYFGRKTNPKNGEGRVAYYFKAFDGIQFKQQYLDGNAIDENVYNSDSSSEAETYVEIKMSITNKDCREYFKAHEGIMESKISSISLLSAVETVIDGVKYYQNIRPVTKLHFPTEILTDETKGIDIVYSLFY